MKRAMILHRILTSEPRLWVMITGIRRLGSDQQETTDQTLLQGIVGFPEVHEWGSQP